MGYNVYFIMNGGIPLYSPVYDVLEIPDLDDYIPYKPSTETYSYEFGGWYYDVECTVQALTGDPITGNTQLYALWIETQIGGYSITFVENGGTPIPDDLTNQTAIPDPLPSISKTGLTFDAWRWGNSSTAVAVVPGEPIYVDATIYAIFTGTTYNITYVLDGGTNHPSNPSTYNSGGSTIYLYNATKSGYTFDGWYLDSGFTTEVTYIASGSTGDKTFYAKFTIVTPTGYSITYIEDGGLPAPTDLTNRTTLPNPLPTITKSGYVFVNWYLDSSFASVAIPGASIATNTILYAKWTIPTEGYYVSFAENGGIPEQLDLAGQHSLPATLPTLQKNDYVFDGWYLEDTYETLATPGATISVDTILYAKFTRNVTTKSGVAIITSRNYKNNNKWDINSKGKIDTVICNPSLNAISEPTEVGTATITAVSINGVDNVALADLYTLTGNYGDHVLSYAHNRGYDPINTYEKAKGTIRVLFGSFVKEIDLSSAIPDGERPSVKLTFNGKFDYITRGSSEYSNYPSNTQLNSLTFNLPAWIRSNKSGTTNDELKWIWNQDSIPFNPFVRTPTQFSFNRETNELAVPPEDEVFTRWYHGSKTYPNIVIGSCWGAFRNDWDYNRMFDPAHDYYGYILSAGKLNCTQDIEYVGDADSDIILSPYYGSRNLQIQLWNISPKVTLDVLTSTKVKVTVTVPIRISYCCASEYFYFTMEELDNYSFTDYISSIDIQINARAFSTDSKEIVTYKNSSGAIVTDGTKGNHIFNLQNNEILTIDTVVGEQLWTKYIPEEILTIFSKGRYKFTCDVALSFFVSNNLQVGTHVFIKQQDNTWISRGGHPTPFSIKNITYKFDRSENIVTLKLIESVRPVNALYMLFNDGTEVLVEVINSGTLKEIVDVYVTQYNMDIADLVKIIYVGSDYLSSTGTWDNSYAELFYIDLSCVTTIDVQAFVESENIMQVHLGPQITSIPTGAFRDSTLEQINLSNVTSVGASSFNGCHLESIDLTSIEIVYEYGFANISTLKSIYLSNACGDALAESNIFYNDTNIEHVWYDGLLSEYLSEQTRMGLYSDPMEYADWLHYKDAQGNWQQISKGELE